MVDDCRSSITNIFICPTLRGFPFFVVLPSIGMLSAIILFFNFLSTIFLGRLFKFELEELILAGALTSGGPMNGVAIAISKQWNKCIHSTNLVLAGNPLAFNFA